MKIVKLKILDSIAFIVYIKMGQDQKICIQISNNACFFIIRFFLTINYATFLTKLPFLTKFATLNIFFLPFLISFATIKKGVTSDYLMQPSFS